MSIKHGLSQFHNKKNAGQNIKGVSVNFKKIAYHLQLKKMPCSIWNLTQTPSENQSSVEYEFLAKMDRLDYRGTGKLENGLFIR